MKSISRIPLRCWKRVELVNLAAEGLKWGAGRRCGMMATEGTQYERTLETLALCLKVVTYTVLLANPACLLKAKRFRSSLCYVAFPFIISSQHLDSRVNSVPP